MFLGLLCLLVYNANLRCIGAGDTLPARFLPFAIWGHGTLKLDPIARLVARGHPSYETWREPPGPGSPGTLFEPWAYWMIETRHHRLASLYPIVAPVLVAPLYLPVSIALEAEGWQPWQVHWLAAIMEKLSASLLATVTVLVVYRLLQRDAGRWALPLAVAFAFGTNTWMTSSQALWQHGTGELLVALALLLVTSTLTPARCAALGAVSVAMAANRPPDALLAAAIVLYAVWAARRMAAWLVAGAVFPLALVVAYNMGVTGSLAGGYGTVDRPDFFEHSLWAGLAGVLVSPMRGLLVFSPFLLFVPLGLVRRLRAPGTRVLAALLAAALVAQLVLYAMADWRAGSSWGPRWLTDLLPVLMWMLAPAPLLLRPLARAALVATMAASIAVQAIGAFWYTGLSDQALYASADGWMRSAWRVANAPFVAELRHPRQRGDLACSARGHLDRIGPAPPVPAGAAAAVIASGTSLHGWALACGRTPAELLLLADGLVVGQTRQFAPARPDVAAAMAHRRAFDLERRCGHARPRARRARAADRRPRRGDERHPHREREPCAGRATPHRAHPPRRCAAARAPERRGLLADDAHGRAALRQPGPGDEHVPDRDAGRPVGARWPGSTGSRRCWRRLVVTSRPRSEPDGLVRYHGLPDGPGDRHAGVRHHARRGRHGPDLEDRSAAARRPQARAAMLRVLEAYRDARGFYRTWLAPEERYQCLNPGRDPNPPDVTIQMHVLMLLAETDRAAAKSLCQALAAQGLRREPVGLLRAGSHRAVAAHRRPAADRLRG